MKWDCDNVQSELSAYIDNELPPAERTLLEKHLGNCPRCQRQLEELQTLATGVTALSGLQPPREFLTEVRREIARAGMPQWKVWQDHLFRPIWLKVPLETVAVVVIVALMMRIERPASERALKYEAKQGVGQETAPALTLNQPPSTDKLVPGRLVGVTADEALRPPVPAAAVVAAPLTSTVELQQRIAAVVVVHAKDISGVQNRAQQLAAAMGGRVVPPSNRTAAQTFFVELPPGDVASFKSRLLEATERGRVVDERLLAGELGAVPSIAPLSTASTGIGPRVLTGTTATNLIPVGGFDRPRAAAENKAATAVLEIQVMPPTN